MDVQVEGTSVCFVAGLCGVVSSTAAGDCSAQSGSLQWTTAEIQRSAAAETA